MDLKRELGLPTAIFVVVASMIGTGIFVTTGSVLGMTKDAWVVLVLWGVGGVVAITGSLCYAELSTIWPDVGGEYVYLKKTFGLLPSFLSGWISLIVGFSASVALSVLTLVKYLDQFLINLQGEASSVFLSGEWTQRLFAAILIFILGAMHIQGVKSGNHVQNILTILKVLIVITLIGFGFYLADWTFSDRLVSHYSTDGNATNSSFSTIGLVLLIIMFSFSGWNGASYISGEIKNPKRNLPYALFFGTLLTTILYIGLNIIFLISTDGKELMGKETVGAIATKNLFGSGISQFFNLGIVLVLLSSISVQLMLGPRVYYAMAKDKVIFQSLATISSRFKTPAQAIAIQMIIAIIYVFVGQRIEILMTYVGFAVGIFPLMAVIGLIYLRIKHPELPRPYKVPLYPIVPLIFIILTIGMMVAGFIAWTSTSLVALTVILLGIPVFYLWRWFVKRRNTPSITSDPLSPESISIDN